MNDAKANALNAIRARNNSPDDFVLVQDDAWGIGAVPKDDPDSPVMGPHFFTPDVWAAIVAAGDAEDVEVEE